MAVTAVTLPGVPNNLLPRNITGPIFERATEQSAIMQLARRVPLALQAETAIPVPLDVPLADWVEEGGRKPVSSGGIGVRTMRGKKVAVLIPVSEEVARTNPAALYSQLQNDLPTSIARAFDYAAIHGKRLQGGAGPFTDYLLKDAHEIVLGSSTKADGGLYADVVKGMVPVVDEGYAFSGFVADPRFKPQLMLGTDTTGRPLFVDTTTAGTNAAGGGTLIGENLRYSTGISGILNRQSQSADQNVRLVGGDWSQVAYGVGMDITVKVSDVATYVDQDGTVHSAFQENLVLLLAEAYYGLIVGDSAAFTKYVTTATP